MKKAAILLLAYLTMVNILVPGKATYASSASVAFSADSNQYAVGDSFIVTLTGESSSGVRAFQTYVAYDPNVLELVDVGSHVTGSDGLIFISDLKHKSQVCTYHMKFRAIAPADSTEVYISDTIYMYSLNKSEQMSVSKNTLKLNITESQMVNTLDENKGLKSLSVNEGTLTPEFSTDIQEYHVTVSSETEVLYVDAKARLKADQVKIEGNTDLKEGDNICKVTVTAKKGCTKTYTIIVTKEAKVTEDDEDEGENEEIPETKSECMLGYGDDGLLHLCSSVNLKVLPVPEPSDIPDGFVESVLELNDMNIAVYVPQNDTASDFVLVYGMIGDGEAKFYKFDRVGQTLQRYIIGEQLSAETENSDENGDSNQKYMYVFIGIIVLGGLFLSSRLLKMKKDISRYDEE